MGRRDWLLGGCRRISLGGFLLLRSEAKEGFVNGFRFHIPPGSRRRGIRLLKTSGFLWRHLLIDFRRVWNRTGFPLPGGRLRDGRRSWRRTFDDVPVDQFPAGSAAMEQDKSELIGGLARRKIDRIQELFDDVWNRHVIPHHLDVDAAIGRGGNVVVGHLDDDAMASTAPRSFLVANFEPAGVVDAVKVGPAYQPERSGTEKCQVNVVVFVVRQRLLQKPLFPLLVAT